MWGGGRNSFLGSPKRKTGGGERWGAAGGSGRSGASRANRRSAGPGASQGRPGPAEASSEAHPTPPRLTSLVLAEEAALGVGERCSVTSAMAGRGRTAATRARLQRRLRGSGRLHPAWRLRSTKPRRRPPRCGEERGLRGGERARQGGAERARSERGLGPGGA